MCRAVALDRPIALHLSNILIAMKLYSFLKPVTLFTALLTAASLQASNVDITLVPVSNGQLEVRLRPSTNFNGMVSSLVFTVKWDASSEAHLGVIQQEAPAATYLPISRSGGEQDAGGDRYQIFVGFGMTPMEWIPFGWVAGQEYTVATLPATGAAEFSLVNNTWTGLNNADYYVSLGGTDETGTIYGDISTGVVAGDMGDGSVNVVPNPTDKTTVITMELQKPQSLQMELLNAAGQSVWKESMPNATGIIRIPLDLTNFDKGVYLLRVHSADKVVTHRVVKR